MQAPRPWLQPQVQEHCGNFPPYSAAWLAPPLIIMEQLTGLAWARSVRAAEAALACSGPGFPLCREEGRRRPELSLSLEPQAKQPLPQPLPRPVSSWSPALWFPSAFPLGGSQFLQNPLQEICLLPQNNANLFLGPPRQPAVSVFPIPEEGGRQALCPPCPSPAPTMGQRTNSTHSVPCGVREMRPCLCIQGMELNPGKGHKNPSDSPVLFFPT